MFTTMGPQTECTTVHYERCVYVQQPDGSWVYWIIPRATN